MKSRKYDIKSPNDHILRSHNYEMKTWDYDKNQNSIMRWKVDKKSKWSHTKS